MTTDTYYANYMSWELFYYLILGSSLLDVSSCSGQYSSVCERRKLSVICKSEEMRGKPLPQICDNLYYII